MKIRKKAEQFLKKEYIDYIIILLLAIVALTWFKGYHHILGAAFGWRVDFNEYWNSASNSWLEASLGYGGSGARQIPFLFPFIALGSLFQSIFHTSIVYEMVYFYFFFALSGISMYLLLKKINVNRLPRLIGAVFYMVNPFAIISIWSLQQGMIFQFYAALPLGIYLLMRSLEDNRYFLKANLILLLVGINASYTNPTFFFMFGVFCFAYAAFKIGKAVFSDKKEVKSLIKRALYFGGTYILLNLFWLIPFLFDMTTEYAQADHTTYGLQNDLDTLKLNSTNFFNIFRLLGYWALTGEAKPDEYYFPWFMDLYTNPLVIALTFILPVLIMLGIIFYKKSKVKYPIFWIIAFLFLLFTIAGLNSPFVESMEKFYEAHPFLLRTFRQGYNKFGIIYATMYTLVFSMGLQFLYHKFKNKVLYLLIPVLVLAIPVFAGSLIYSENKTIIRSTVVDLPEDYLTFQDWERNNNLNARYLELPLIQGTNTIYEWEKGYSGMDLLFSLSMNPVVFSVHSNDIVNQLALTIKNNDYESFNKLLPFLNVQKIIVNNDICPECLNNYAAGGKAETSKFVENLELTESIGKTFRIIDTPTDQFLQRAYIPFLNIYSKYLDIEHFEGLVLPDSTPLRTAVFFNKYNVPKRYIFNDNKDKFAKVEPASLNPQIENIVNEDEDSYEYIDMDFETFNWRNLLPNTYTAFDTNDGWFTVVRTDGQEANRSKSFRSVEDAPYEFPEYSKGYWNTKNSTLLYLKTGAEELAIEGISYESEQLPVNSIWWDTGWSGMGTKDVIYPVVIPPNQNVIIQIDDSSLIPELISIERNALFAWDMIEGGEYTIRTYFGWKTITKTDGTEKESTLSFDSPEEAPYEFPSFSSKQWNAYKPTLIYLKAGDEDIVITNILNKGEVVSIGGAWWETGWMGMMTEPVGLPVTIPKHQKAIIHLDNIKRKDLNSITVALDSLNCNPEDAEINWSWLEERTFYAYRFEQENNSAVIPTNKSVYDCSLNNPDNSYVYVKTGEEPLYLVDIKENGESLDDIFGVWWDDGGALKQDNYRTMRKGKHLLPIKLPSNKNVILQIQHVIGDDVEVIALPEIEYTKLANHNPTLEFKQISRSEYRFRIYNVKEDFPLVLNERYHDKWEAFVKPMKDDAASPDAAIAYTSNVPVYDPFEMDDGTPQPYKGDAYVSKMIEGSVQNDNLPGSVLFENKGVKIPDGDHLVANGYANAWWIDVDNLCADIETLEKVVERNKITNEANERQNKETSQYNKFECERYKGEWDEEAFECLFEEGVTPEEEPALKEKAPIYPTYEKLLSERKKGKTFCVQNPDGSYNIEVIAEFKLQKLFYVGLTISVLALIGIIGLLVYPYIARKHKFIFFKRKR